MRPTPAAFGLACAATTLCLAATGLAQTPAPQVSPPAHEFFEAPRATGFPVGHPTRTTLRYLEVHDSFAGTPRTIRAIAFRRRADDPSTAPAFDAQITLRLSTAATTAATIDPSFAANHGPDLVEVTPSRTVSFPATGPTTEPLAAFDFEIPADTPFVFGGLGPLCIEIVVAGHTNAVPLQFSLATEDDLRRSTEIARGCGGLGLSVDYLASNPASGSLDIARHRVSGSLPGSPVFLLFGTRTDLLAGAVPLPFDLTPFGGPGCSLRVDIAVSLAGLASYDQTFTQDVDISGAPPGALYFVQALSPLVFREPSTSPRSLLASDTAAVWTSSPRTAGRVWSEDLSSATGVAQPVFGLVVQAR